MNMKMNPYEFMHCAVPNEEEKACFWPTILILEKLTNPSSVKFGVPSSMNAKSVRYMPKYGTHGGLQLWAINQK